MAKHFKTSWIIFFRLQNNIYNYCSRENPYFSFEYKISLQNVLSLYYEFFIFRILIAIRILKQTFCRGCELKSSKFECTLAIHLYYLNKTTRSLPLKYRRTLFVISLEFLRKCQCLALT